MKKLISTILTVTAILTCIPFSLSAKTVTFSDVSDTAWFNNAAQYCYDLAYMQGTDDGVFSPSANLTRAMACQLIANHSPLPTARYGTPFVDVKDSHWFYEAVGTAYHDGIVSGMTATTFVPGGNITRQDFVCILYRYAANNEKVEFSFDRYTDSSSIAEYARDALAWACDKGIISGYPDSTLKPRGYITRAETAVMMKLLDGVMGHNWVLGANSERTCNLKGYAEYTCDHCGKGKRIEYSPYHTWNKGVITKVPTCLENGNKRYTCMSCSLNRNEPIPAPGYHNWTSQITLAPACFTDGYKKHTCTSCGTSYAELLPKIGHHVYTGWYTETEATRSVTGVNANKCVYCNYKQTELYRHSSYYQFSDSIDIPSGGYNVSTRNIGMKVIYTNYALLGTTSASFTSQTRNAVIAFQKEYGLPATGVVDINTWLTMGYSEYDWYNLAAYITPRKVTPKDSRQAHIEAMLSTAYEYAKAGSEYRIGASGEPGTYADCSGLIYQCLYSVGINPDTNIIDHGLAEYEYTSRWLAADSKLGLSVPVSQIERGDLVFYANNGTSKVIHVGIYAGDGMIYDAWPEIGTTYRSINIRGAYVIKAIRVFP